MNQILSSTQMHDFQTKGFTVLERVISDDLLRLLRDVCDRVVADCDAKADAAGHARSGKYFVSAWKESPELREFVFSPLMASLTRQLLGPEVFFVFEQFVVKAAEKGGKFAWHQDSGYVQNGAAPANPLYLTCWCPLDDITEENGTVYMLPFERAGGRDIAEHRRDEGDWDLVGYRGDDPGDPVICPAGSIALFGSNVFHRSGPNTTNTPRRVYLSQYAPAPVLKADRTLFYLCEPFLQNGEVVAETASGS